MTNLTIRPAVPDEWDTISTLIAHCLSQGDVRRYEQLLHERRVILPQKPGFTLDTVRVGLVNGRIVSVGGLKTARFITGIPRCARRVCWMLSPIRKPASVVMPAP